MKSNVLGYPNMLFHDIYPSYEIFENGKKDSVGDPLILGYKDIPEFNVIETTTPDGENYFSTLKTIYLLLLDRYGNSPIANSDINQFAIKLFSTIYQYGPTWQVKKQIQYKLRNLKDSEIREGAKAIYNHAFNPDSEPNTNTLEELDYINDQNTTNYKKSKIEGSTALWEVLRDNIDSSFMDKFRKLFLQIARPTREIYYVTEEGDYQ